jgi:hypothetical protein
MSSPRERRPSNASSIAPASNAHVSPYTSTVSAAASAASKFAAFKVIVRAWEQWPYRLTRRGGGRGVQRRDGRSLLTPPGLRQALAGNNTVEFAARESVVGTFRT